MEGSPGTRLLTVSEGSPPRGFISLWFHCHLQSNVSEMIDAVKAGFIERLDKNSWLDDTTREASKEKVRAITKMVAFPDQLYNDTYLNNLYAEVSGS